MPVSDAQRQRKRRKKLKEGKFRQLQVSMSPDVAAALDSLCDSLHVTKVELIGRLILEESKRKEEEMAAMEKEELRKKFEGMPEDHGSWSL